MIEIRERAEYELRTYHLGNLEVEESTHKSHWIVTGKAWRPGKKGNRLFSINVIPPIDWDLWGVAARAQLEMLFAIDE